MWLKGSCDVTHATRKHECLVIIAFESNAFVASVTSVLAAIKHVSARHDAKQRRLSEIHCPAQRLMLPHFSESLRQLGRLAGGISDEGEVDAQPWFLVPRTDSMTYSM